MLAPMFDLHYTDLRLIAKVKKAQELIDSNAHVNIFRGKTRLKRV
jgi:hypothetical protein